MSLFGPNKACIRPKWWRPFYPTRALIREFRRTAESVGGSLDEPVESVEDTSDDAEPPHTFLIENDGERSILLDKARCKRWKATKLRKRAAKLDRQAIELDGQADFLTTLLFRDHIHYAMATPASKGQGKRETLVAQALALGVYTRRIGDGETQILYCPTNDASGGHSVLVDAIACAEELQRRDLDAFALLATEKAVFTSIADTWQIVNRATVIDVDEDGDILGSRCHPALLARRMRE